MSYKTYLKSIGRKPIRGKLRTEKTPGSIEIVWDPETRDYIAHIHEGPPKLKLVTNKRRAA